MSIPYSLLSLLADGRFHSGEELGRALGVSRSAIWKQLKQLEKLQIPLFSVPGRGYQIPDGLALLDRESLLAHMGGADGRFDRIEIFPELDSTNRYLLDRARESPGQVAACLAEYQSAGRGRRGRTWVSPFAANLYLSLLWPFAPGTGGLSGLSLAVALTVCEALEAMGLAAASLKWPNDILVDGRKLAGILLEIVGEAGGPCQVVIGIGLNVRMPKSQGQGIDQPWVDLQTVLGRLPCRNELAGRVLSGLVRMLPRFEREGLAPLLQAWQLRDGLMGRTVNLALPNETIPGRWAGIDSDGAGLLDTEQGRRRVLAGEVSLRLAS